MNLLVCFKGDQSWLWFSIFALLQEEEERIEKRQKMGFLQVLFTWKFIVVLLAWRGRHLIWFFGNFLVFFWFFFSRNENVFFFEKQYCFLLSIASQRSLIWSNWIFFWITGKSKRCDWVEKVFHWRRRTGEQILKFQQKIFPNQYNYLRTRATTLNRRNQSRVQIHFQWKKLI